MFCHYTLPPHFSVNSRSFTRKIEDNKTFIIFFYEYWWHEPHSHHRHHWCLFWNQRYSAYTSIFIAYLPWRWGRSFEKEKMRKKRKMFLLLYISRKVEKKENMRTVSSSLCWKCDEWEFCEKETAVSRFGFRGGMRYTSIKEPRLWYNISFNNHQHASADQQNGKKGKANTNLLKKCTQCTARMSNGKEGSLPPQRKCLY